MGGLCVGGCMHLISYAKYSQGLGLLQIRLWSLSVDKPYDLLLEAD